MTAAHRAMLLMLAFAGTWAALEIVGASMHRAYSPYEVVWCRYGLHLALMLALFGPRDPLALVRSRRPAFQVARSLLMLVMPASWIMAGQRGVDVGTMTAALALIPLLVMMFGAVFLRERPANWMWIASTMASAGCVACALPLAGTVARQLLLPLTTAASFSLYVVMTRSLRTETTRANLFYTALGVFVVLSAFIERVWITPDAHDLACLVAIALIGYIGLYALDRCAADAPVGVSAPLAACQIPIGLLLTALLGHGKPVPGTWAAVALIGSAMLLAFRYTTHLPAEHAID
jgi:drug/metabolite transporter (DMT)-like permease